MMSLLVLSICQNPKVGSNDNEGMNFPSREKKERASFLIPCPLYKGSCGLTTVVTLVTRLNIEGQLAIMG